MNFIQGTLQMMEVGKGSFIIRVVPFFMVLGLIAFFSNFTTYKGLPDSQSMDNAQLARQIVRGKGFTTEFIRPHAVAQIHNFIGEQQGLGSGKAGDLFPSDKFGPGTPRTLPDTYNAPGYPYALAAWFMLVHPDFDEPPSGILAAAMYSPDRWIPFFNQGFLVLTAFIVFILGLRLFDQRVAWMALVSFILIDMVWHFTLTALSTTFLTFLVTAAFLCIEQVVSVGEQCFEREERSFLPAYVWGVLLIGFLVAIALTRLQMLIFLAPVVTVLLLMPNASILLASLVGIVTLAAVTPWYLHLDAICGSFFGSNGPLMLHGSDGYEGNQIYCTTAIPTYEQVFKFAARKEYNGFSWNFQHAWSLLGSNPMVLLFGASIFHQFKRRRTRIFHWLIFGAGIVILLANNLGEDKPDAISSWNALALLVPCMVVVGSAFFFIMLDRLSLQLWLMNNLIVILVLLLTALPLILSLLSPGRYPFAWPPYWPHTIKAVSQFAQPDEWVTTDIPWATAWYGDRASLWLPDSITDFENYHDNVCPTGMLIFTPETWEGTVSAITTGEYKDWFPLMTAEGIPQNFPLSEHLVMSGKIPGYTLYSDRPRWMMK